MANHATWYLPSRRWCISEVLETAEIPMEAAAAGGKEDCHGVAEESCHVRQVFNSEGRPQGIVPYQSKCKLLPRSLGSPRLQKWH